MSKYWKRLLLAGFAVQLGLFAMPLRPALADTASEISRDAYLALASLTNGNQAAASMAKKARAILVFPKIIKAGFLFGAQYGQGALIEKGRTVGYYQSAAGSYGLQAGAQTFGYVMFLMTDDAMHLLDSTKGWELGVGPSIVVMDQGMASSMTTTTLGSDAYAFIFNQTGLMAGLGLQGSKITRFTPDE